MYSAERRQLFDMELSECSVEQARKETGCAQAMTSCPLTRQPTDPIRSLQLSSTSLYYSVVGGLSCSDHRLLDHAIRGTCTKLLIFAKCSKGRNRLVCKLSFLDMQKEAI